MTGVQANSVALGTDTTGNYASAVTAGSGITVTGSAGEGTSFAVAHTDTSSQASVSNSGSDFIQSITLDTFGHVTAITSGTVSGGGGGTTYTAGGDYGLTLSGTEFRLEDDRRRNADTDIYDGNTSDYIHYDTDVGIRFYTAGAEDARLTDGGDLHVDGDVIGYSTTISDERLKHNIKKMDNALEKVSELNGYTFTYSKEDGKKSAGVIAQEVEKVLPSAVDNKSLAFHGQDDVEYKTVQYDQLHGLLIEAIKELKAEIEELKNGSSQ